jgi:hypothetical protein
MQPLIPTSFHTRAGHVESDTMQHAITSFAESYLYMFSVAQMSRPPNPAKTQGYKKNQTILEHTRAHNHKYLHYIRVCKS